MSTGIQWTQETWNPTTGCDRISAGCDNCLAPETRVLRADMTWAPIADIKVGDRLVSFTDKPAIGQNRVWEEATVQAVWETHKPTVAVELANGAKFTASEDHLWLIAKRGASQWWRKTIGLNFKTEVRALQCTPTHTDSDDYRAGYIAGATEGDGTFRWDPSWRSSSMGYPQSYWRVAKPEQDVDVLDRLVEYLDHFDVNIAVRSFDQGVSGFTDNPLPMAKVETRRLSDLALIARLSEERPSREWMSGWLAGMFDTDASYSGGNLRFCQSKPNGVLDRVERYGKELGFHLKAEHYEGTDCPTVRLMGGIAENIAFLSSIHPALTRRCRDFYGKRIETPTSPVVGIRRGPAQRLIDITTSTGTFVAEGALTHNCYALTMAKRLKGMGQAKYQNDGDLRTSGPGFGLTVHEDALTLPYRWRKPRTVFVNSMSDLFHARVPKGFIRRVFAVMADTPQHTYQVLTKRSTRLRRMAGELEWPPNLWMGVSVEDATQMHRVADLATVPAAVRFLSLEPLLGPLYGLDLSEVDWAIVGGESGSGAREMSVEWAQSIVADCRDRDVPVFVKQLGSVYAQDTSWGGKSVAAWGDTKGGDPKYWPADLRVREFPRLEAVTP